MKTTLMPAVFTIVMGLAMLWLSVNPETLVAIDGVWGVILRMVLAAMATGTAAMGIMMLRDECVSNGHHRSTPVVISCSHLHLTFHQVDGSVQRVCADCGIKA